MKRRFLTLIFIFIILNLITKTLEECIPNQNCPKRQGYCNSQSICECINGFYTLLPKSKTIPNDFIYCNYERTSKWIPFFLELFIPPFGHFYAGRILNAVIKLIIEIIPFVGIIFGFLNVYPFGQVIDSEIPNDNINEEQQQLTGDNKSEDVDIQDVSITKGQVTCKALPIIFTIASVVIFIVMDLFDLFAYLFRYYNDGNGVPLL